MSRMFKGLCLCLLVFGSPMNAYADILGVQDLGMIAQMGKQLVEMKKQYDKMQEQLNSANKLTQLNSGHYRYGTLLNDASSFQKRRTPDANWRATLSGVSGGNPQRYKDLVSAYEKQHPQLRAATLNNRMPQARRTQFEEEKAITETASVESEAALNEINDALDRIHKLSLEIENADSTKAAIDLNTRMLAEMAYLQVESVKAQAIMNQQLAMRASSDLENDTAFASYVSH
jgi:type IV secretion system protein VirB5